MSSCRVRGREGCQALPDVEYRVNMTEDRDSWQASHFIPVCCPLEGAFLCQDARKWPNGKPRRWVESRRVEPWTRLAARSVAP